jgi:hypothetical protein
MQVSELLSSAREIRSVAETVANGILRDELNAIACRFERLAFSADERLEGEPPPLDLRPPAN